MNKLKYSANKFIKKTIWCKNKRNQRIYGVAIIPDDPDKFPLVYIFSRLWI